MLRDHSEWKVKSRASRFRGVDLGKEAEINLELTFYARHSLEQR